MTATRRPIQLDDISPGDEVHLALRTQDGLGSVRGVIVAYPGWRTFRREPKAGKPSSDWYLRVRYECGDEEVRTRDVQSVRIIKRATEVQP